MMNILKNITIVETNNYFCNMFECCRLLQNYRKKRHRVFYNMIDNICKNSLICCNVLIMNVLLITSVTTGNQIVLGIWLLLTYYLSFFYKLCNLVTK